MRTRIAYVEAAEEGSMGLLTGLKPLSLDWETFYGTGYSLRMSSVSYTDYVHDPKFRIECVAITTDQGTEWAHTDKAIELAKSIDWPKYYLVGQNSAFDALILSVKCGVIPKVILDTMGMGRALMPGLPKHNLETLVKMLGVGVKKKEVLLNARNKHWEDMDPLEQTAYKQYNIDDAEQTFKLAEIMIPRMPEDELYLLNQSMQMWLNPILEVDTVRARALRTKLEAERKAIIKASGISKTVLASSTQFAELLRNKFGLELPLKENDKGDMIPALAKGDIGFATLQADHPELQHIFAGRLAATSSISDTRLARMISCQEKTGNLPILLNYAGAKHTKRWSGGNKMNPQNFSARDKTKAEIRSCITAPKGHVLVVGDKSQIECRILAWLADEEPLLKIFREKGDPYAQMASAIYNMEVTKETEPAKRQTGKVAELGCGFGMGPPKFRNTAATDATNPMWLTLEEAQHIVYTYRNLRSKISAYWNEAGEQIWKMFNYDRTRNNNFWKCIDIEHKALRLPNGLRIEYPALRYDGGNFHYGISGESKKLYGGKVTENQAQGLARVDIGENMIEVEKTGYPIALVVHDEIVCCVPEWEADDCKAALFEILSAPPSFAPDMPADAEVSYSEVYTK